MTSPHIKAYLKAKSVRLAGAGCAAALVLLAGCSSQDSESTEDTAAETTSAPDTAGAAPEGTPAEPPAAAGDNRVTFGNADVGPVTAVTCQTDNGVTRITIEGSQQTVVELTDEDAPTVQSVSIGQAGSEGPSLMFLQGVSATPETTRDGQHYTIKGAGLGAESAEAAPVETPFEIAVSCP